MLLYLRSLFYRTNRPHCPWVYKLNKPNWEISQKSQRQVLNKLLEWFPNWFYYAGKPMGKATYFLKNSYLWFMYYPLNKNLWSRISHNILIISCCFPFNSMNSEKLSVSSQLGQTSFQNWKTCILCFAVEVKVLMLGFCLVAYLSCWLVIRISKRIYFLFERLINSVICSDDWCQMLNMFNCNFQFV